MPLTTCPDCKNRISDQAPACPQCGRPMGTPNRSMLRLGIALGLVFLLLAGVLVAVNFYSVNNP